MTTARNLAMADLDTQIQQAALVAQVPTAPTAPLPPEDTTVILKPDYAKGYHSGAELQQAFPVIRPTYSSGGYVPNVAPGEAPPPPPKSTQNRASQEQQQQTVQQRLERQRLRFALQAGQVGRSTSNFLAGSNRNLGSIPTPGGIWTPFWILIGLYLILIPVNGHTRLNWFWLALIGSAQIDAALTTNVGTAVQTGVGTVKQVTIPETTPSPFTPIPLVAQTALPLGNYLFGLNQSSEIGGL